MLLLFLLRFLLPIALVVLVWLAYFFSLCYLWKHRVLHQPADEKGKKNGLSESELQELPTSDDVVGGTECAVCLDEVEKGQVARVLPACSHVFHLQCADAWLSTKAVCPVCRMVLGKPAD